jgi:hypothetical protein
VLRRAARRLREWHKKAAQWPKEGAAGKKRPLPNGEEKPDAKRGRISTDGGDASTAEESSAQEHAPSAAEGSKDDGGGGSEAHVAGTEPRWVTSIRRDSVCCAQLDLADALEEASGDGAAAPGGGVGSESDGAAGGEGGAGAGDTVDGGEKGEKGDKGAKLSAADEAAVALLVDALGARAGAGLRRVVLQGGESGEEVAAQIEGGGGAGGGDEGGSVLLVLRTERRRGGVGTQGVRAARKCGAVEAVVFVSCDADAMVPELCQLGAPPHHVHERGMQPLVPLAGAGAALPSLRDPLTGLPLLAVAVALVRESSPLAAALSGSAGAEGAEGRAYCWHCGFERCRKGGECKVRTFDRSVHQDKEAARLAALDDY